MVIATRFLITMGLALYVAGAALAESVADDFCKLADNKVAKPKDFPVKGTKCKWTAFCDMATLPAQLVKNGTKSDEFSAEKFPCEYCWPDCPESKKEPKSIGCYDPNNPLVVKLKQTYGPQVNPLGFVGNYSTELKETIGFLPEEKEVKVTMGTPDLKLCTWSKYDIKIALFTGRVAAKAADFKWSWNPNDETFCKKKGEWIGKPADVNVKAGVRIASMAGNVFDWASARNNPDTAGKCPMPAE